MATTYTTSLIAETVFGNKRISIVKLAFTAIDSTGVACTAAGLGLASLGAVDLVIPIIGTIVNNGPVAGLWFSSTGYVHFITATNAEASATVTFDAYFIVIGS